jgi:glycosyltransferase involved in cell wall biosynthesis
VRFSNNIDYFAYADNFALNSHIISNLKYGSRQAKPFISIMIPSYKRPELLGEAIRSILNQNGYGDFEIVIVDNDDSLEYHQQIIDMLQSFADGRISYYVNAQNIGIFGNWNRCIELAHGAFMTILSDDDFLLPNFLSSMVSFINQHDNVARIEGKYLTYYQLTNNSFKFKFKKLVRKYILGGNDNLQIGWYHYLSQVICFILRIKYKKITLQMYLSGCFTAPHSQLYRVEYARQIGGFNPNYAPIADYVFNACYVNNYDNCYQINEYIGVYRIFVNDSLSRSIGFNCVKGDREFTNYLLKRHLGIFNNILRFFYIKCRYLSFKRSRSILLYGNLYRVIKLFYNLPFK